MAYECTIIWCNVVMAGLFCLPLFLENASTLLDNNTLDHITSRPLANHY